MKRLMMLLLLSQMLSSVMGIEIWQKNNRWFDLNFISESEYAHSFVPIEKHANHFLTDNSLAIDANHMNFKIGICDYRTEHFFEQPVPAGHINYNVPQQMEAVYSDFAFYMQPRLRIIFSMKVSSINQPAPYYNRLSTPVGKIALLRQFPWNYAFITLEGSYASNLQANESTNSSKTTPSKYVGSANHMSENTVIFNTPDLFDASKHHFRTAFNYYSNIKRGFSPLPDKLPLIYTPDGTFVFKSSYDYLIDEDRGTLTGDDVSHTQKLSVDANYRFWHVFELSGQARAVDYQVDNTLTDRNYYDATASVKGYLYDFDEAKLIPAVSYRHIESYDNTQKQLMRLDRMFNLAGYACMKLNKNVLVSLNVSEDVMVSWYHNDIYPETLRIDYNKHNHIFNAAMGLTIWY